MKLLKPLCVAGLASIPLISQQAISAISVTASGHDGNVPQNTLDGSLASRWSAKGDGQWIKFDLGSKQTVDDLDIAFYKGDVRYSYFEIQTSNDNKAWATVYSGTSRLSAGLKNYNIADTVARYVRILGHGNSSNTWNSLTEVRVNTIGGSDQGGSSSGSGGSTSPSVTKTVWSENFSLSDNTTKDTGSTGWSLSTSKIKSTGYLKVVNGKLNAKNTGGEVSWVSESINIQGLNAVQISAEVSGKGKLDAPDYIEMGYKIDNGAIRRFEKRNDDLSLTTVSIAGLSGNSLTLYSYFKTSAGDEHYYLDNVKVVGSTSGSGTTDQQDDTTNDEPDNSDSVNPVGSLDPSVAPGFNFDLSKWKITFPDASEGDVNWLKNGGQRSNEFYTDPKTGGMVFRCPNSGATTSNKTKYPRSELREMLRGTNTSISTLGVTGNNWVLSTANSTNRNKAGGVDGKLSATLSVDHVSTTGDSEMVGRVIVGQIHGEDDEPLKIYYRKLPGHSKGSVYFAYEKWQGDDVKYPLIGSWEDDARNPADGIPLGEKWSYEVDVNGRDLTVTIYRENGLSVSESLTMESEYSADWMYFKAGVYNQNNGGDSGDYVQATFYDLQHSHH